MHRSRQIFVVATGAYDNLGDIVLRRVLLQWLKRTGPLHVYVGRSPAEFDQGLELSDNDRVYHSIIRFYLAGLRAAARGRAHYVFKPGEIQMSIQGLKEHVGMLPLVAAVRLTGGKAVRVGTGSRNWSRLPATLLRPSIWLSNLTYWREADTARYMAAGEIMPDLAFAAGSDLQSGARKTEKRDRLAISMRGDKEFPSAAWIEAIKTFAKGHQLRLVVVTQVKGDGARSRQIARLECAECVDWKVGDSSQALEGKLRAIYRESAVVVSDRLHVLILAATEGAVPLGLVTNASGKIGRHFDAAGMSHIELDTRERTTRDMLDQLEAALGRRDELSQALEKARAQLDAVSSNVRGELR